MFHLENDYKIKTLSLFIYLYWVYEQFTVYT